jgi:hypothetical protein
MMNPTNLMSTPWSPMRLSRKIFLTLAAASSAVLGGATACTDLDEVPQSALSPDTYYQTDAQVLGAVAGTYSTLKGTLWGYYNIGVISADEMLVPTRGQDWYDNGRWLELFRQGWTPTSGTGTADINDLYNTLSGGIANANAALNAPALNVASLSPTRATMKAELRALRAYYYYMMLDLWGGVPIVTDVKIGVARPRDTADSVFRFIEGELKAAKADLPATWNAANYGRLTKGAINAILASLYLNAPVFRGTTTAAGLTPAAPMWQQASDYADSVINSGVYTMQTRANWIKNFTADNLNSPENIFVVRNRAQQDLGLTIPMRGSHYNQPQGGWNGFAVLAKVYTQYDSVTAPDIRRSAIQIGQQVDFSGANVKDRQGNNLVFTLNINDITAAAENEGPRMNKFQYNAGDPAPVGGNYQNDYTIFRLAEMYLIKAEAQNELGNTAAATTALNVVKVRAMGAGGAYSGAATQAAVRSEIFVERQRELAGEGKRRQDAVRGGFFATAVQYRPTPGGAYKVRMPIPSPQLQTNPLLTQNAGY